MIYKTEVRPNKVSEKKVGKGRERGRGVERERRGRRREMKVV